MTLFIRNVRPRNNGSELLVTVELSDDNNIEKRNLAVLTQDWSYLLNVRGEIDSELFDRLETADRYSTAVRLGTGILAYGANSRAGLIMKLRRKGCDSESAVAAAEYLCGCGFVDEFADAERLAERDLKKLYGKRRILSDIYAKGYGDSVVAYISEFLGEVDFPDMCAKLILKRYRADLSDLSDLSGISFGSTEYKKL